MIRALFRFIFASPLRAAVVCGFLVAVGFGLASYPDPELRKTITDWRLENAFASGADEQRVLSALQAAERGNGELVQLSESDFRALELPYTVGFPIEQDSARRFLIRYAGVDELNGDRVFVADRQVFAAPWWSPHRFIYKAGAAEVRALGEVIDLTFERDVVGLVGLIVFDGLIGAAYGCLIGLIVAVLRGSGLPPLPQGKAPSRTRTASRGGPLNKPGSA